MNDGEVSAADVARERLLLEEGRIAATIGVLRDPAVEQRVGTLVTAGLLRLLAQQRDALASARSATGELRWASVRNRARTCDRLIGECTAIINGSYARPIAHVDAACSEAETLADHLFRITGVARDTSFIPADSECANLVSRVLRRRFADHGIWDLPIVAHEFGHLVERDLIEADLATAATKRPLADLLGGQDRQFAELAADVFAVYTIGPAYALTLVLHRMDPTAPAVAGEYASHPGDPSRVHAVLYALELLTQSDSPALRGQYNFIVSTLRTFWTEAQTDAPKESLLGAMEAARVRARVDKVWRPVSTSTLHSARYTTFHDARRLASQFEKGVDASGTATPLDVVNAAWLVRFRSWRDGKASPSSLPKWARRQLESQSTGTAHHV